MTQLSRSALEAEIASLLADNTSGNITPADDRQVCIDTADSCFNILSDTFATIASGAINCTSLSAAGDIFIANGFGLQGDSITAHTYTIDGYQTTSSAYVPLITITNGATAAMSIASTTNGTVAIDGSIIGGVTPATGTFTTLTTNTAHILSNGTAIKTDTTTAHTGLLQAYSTNATAYVTLAGLSNGALANLTLASSTNGTVTLTDVVNQDSVQATSQSSHVSSTTLSAVTGLSINLSVGSYRISGHLQGSAAASGGLKAELIASNGLVLTSANVTGENWNGTTCNSRTNITALATDFSSSAAAYTDCYFDGTVIVSTAGTINIQAAQNTSNGTATLVNVGSYLEVVRQS